MQLLDKFRTLKITSRKPNQVLLFVSNTAKWDSRNGELCAELEVNFYEQLPNEAVP
jgi:hypothetical protein